VCEVWPERFRSARPNTLTAMAAAAAAAMATVVAATVAVTPAGPPAFDGRVRACITDPLRQDSYMVPPACPEHVRGCKESSNHCASLAVLPSGGVALAWFSGLREGWEYTGAALALLPAPNASSWRHTAAGGIAVPGLAGFSLQNPVLFVDPSPSPGPGGRLLMFGARVPSRPHFLADRPSDTCRRPFGSGRRGPATLAHGWQLAQCRAW
jgi:hypothetical protein